MIHIIFIYHIPQAICYSDSICSLISDEPPSHQHATSPRQTANTAKELFWHLLPGCGCNDNMNYLFII